MVKKKRSSNQSFQQNEELRKKLKNLESKVDKPTQITRIQRLQDLQNKLQGSYKVKRIRRVEKWAYRGQAIGIIAAFLFMAFLEGGSFDPFYVPLAFPLVIAGGWGAVVGIESLIFRLLEMKHRDSKNIDFLLAKKSMRRAYTVIVIFIILFALVFTPFATDRVSGMATMKGDISLDGGEARTINFTSTDRFGLSVTENITVEVTSDNASVSIKIMSEKDYMEERKEAQFLVSDNITKGTAFKTEDIPIDDFKELVLLIESTEDAEIKYQIDRVVPPDRNFCLSIICLEFLTVYLAWLFALYPVKKEYS